VVNAVRYLDLQETDDRVGQAELCDSSRRGGVIFLVVRQCPLPLHARPAP
jgi:hypothetical protein